MAETLLPVNADWASPRRRTFSAYDEPPVVIEQAALQIADYHGKAWTATYLRRVADRLEREAACQNSASA